MDPDLEDVVDLVADVTDDIDPASSSLRRLRHERPRLYYGVVIAIVVMLAVLVYLFA